MTVNKSCLPSQRGSCPCAAIHFAWRHFSMIGFIVCELLSHVNRMPWWRGVEHFHESCMFKAPSRCTPPRAIIPGWNNMKIEDQVWGRERSSTFFLDIDTVGWLERSMACFQIMGANGLGVISRAYVVLFGRRGWRRICIDVLV